MLSCPHCQKAVPDAIPKDRLDRELEAHKETKTALDQAKAGVADLTTKAALAEKHLTRATELEGKLTQAQQAAAIDLAMARSGVSDADVANGFAAAWRGLEEKDRPAFDAWFGDIIADPEKAPKLLRPWVPQAAGTVQTTTQANGTNGHASGNGQTKTTQAFNPNNGVDQSRSPKNASAFNAETIANLRNMGDKGLMEYAAKRQALGQQIGTEMPELGGGNPFRPLKD